MKKLLTSLCILALTLVCIFALPATAQAATEGYYEYSVSDCEATITGYTSTGDNTTIIGYAEEKENLTIELGKMITGEQKDGEQYELEFKVVKSGKVTITFSTACDVTQGDFSCSLTQCYGCRTGWSALNGKFNYSWTNYLEKGDYVYSFTCSGNGTYTITTEYEEVKESFSENRNGGDNNANTANNIILEKDYYGLIMEQDVDVYKFSTTKNCLIELNFIGLANRGWFVYTIYNEKLDVVQKIDLSYFDKRYGQISTYYNTHRLEKGTYYLLIESNTEPGPYSFYINEHKHSYTNSCDTTCNYCNAKRTIKHTYKTTTTKATFTKNGKIVKKCAVCGKVASTTTIKLIKTVKLSATSYTYNGKAKTPTVTVKDSAGKTLKKGTDYTVSYASGRKNVGTYKVTVKMIGNYTGTKVLTFKIAPVKVAKCTVKLSATSYTYNGKVKTPTVTVKDSAGKTLKKNTDYTVTYASGRKNVGTYKVAIKLKGNYTGTKVLTFKILPKAASINKLTAKSKAILVKLNRVTTQSTGYQIQYSTSSKFTSAKTVTVTSYKTSSKTISGLKKGKKYYVRVRTYKTVSKTKFYSAWSAYKSVKTK